MLACGRTSWTRAARSSSSSSSSAGCGGIQYAAEAYRRLRLQRQGVERHLYVADGKLYGNVAVPFGEAPSAAAFSRGALAFGAYLFERVQERAGQEVEAAAFDKILMK